MIKISFLIINYYSAKFVLRLIHSIKENIKKYSYEILVLDNSNSVEEEELLTSINSKSLKYYYPRQNLGFAKGNNFLLESAIGEVLILINPDSLIINGSIELLADYILNNENVGVVGPKIYNQDGSEQISYYRFPTLWTLFQEHILLFKNPYTYKYRVGSSFSCDVIKGACFAIKRETADKYDLFSDEFFMYSEEVDLCKRLKKISKEIIHLPSASIVHYGEKSSRLKDVTEFAIYHYFKSKVIYWSKHSTLFKTKIVKLILFTSLIEKTVLLFLSNHRKSSKIHFNVLKMFLSHE